MAVETTYIDRVCRDLSKKLGYTVFGVQNIPFIQREVYSASTMLGEIDRLKKDLLPRLNSRLEYLSKRFKRLVIIINVVGAALFGVGLIVTIPITIILYRFYYLRNREELLDEKKHVMENISVLEKKYDQLVTEIARKIDEHVSRMHSAVLYENKLLILETFDQLYNLLREKEIIVEFINCPVCNSVLPLPKTGKILTCPHCGLRLKPVDVFKQLREIYRF